MLKLKRYDKGATRGQTFTPFTAYNETMKEGISKCLRKACFSFVQVLYYSKYFSHNIHIVFTLVEAAFCRKFQISNTGLFFSRVDDINIFPISLFNPFCYWLLRMYWIERKRKCCLSCSIERRHEVNRYK